VIHNFLEAPKKIDYENSIFHPLGLFKDKHLEELNFPTLFYGQSQQIGFSYHQINSMGIIS
jgi:hypothetical protein